MQNSKNIPRKKLTPVPKKAITLDLLLNSGMFTKINFNQALALTKANAMDENSSPIEGYNYNKELKMDKYTFPSQLESIKILGSNKDNRSQHYVIYVVDKTNETKTVYSEFWNNDMDTQDGIYVLSPHGKSILEQEETVIDGYNNPKNNISKLPIEMINNILANNNPIYVNKQRTALPLEPQSNKQGGKKRTRCRHGKGTGCSNCVGNVIDNVTLPKATKETNQEGEPVTNVFNIPDDSDPLSEQYKNWLRSIPTASVNEPVQTATRVGGKKIPRKNRRKSKKSKRKTNKSKKSKRKTRKTR